MAYRGYVAKNRRGTKPENVGMGFCGPLSLSLAVSSDAIVQL
jgi:hypothetical protein